MCLAVVAVAAMLVVGRGSAMATEEEVAMAAVEEATMDGVGGVRLKVYLFFSMSHCPTRHGYNRRTRVASILATMILW
jgi:hypothetical protein